MQSRQNPTARRELPASGMNRRLIRAPHGKPVVRHSPNLRERWVKTHPDSSYAVDPGHQGRPEYSPFGLPEGSPTSLLAWLLVAVGVLAVTAALWYMTREAGSPWRAAALLTSAVVGCAWILARSAMDIPGFVRRGDPVAVFRSGKMAPFWLLLPATTVTIVAAGRMQSAGAGAVGWSVGLPWLVGVILFMAAAWWPAMPSWRQAARTAQRPAMRSLAVRSWIPWVALVVIAAAPRLIWLDRFPTIIDGDEGQYLKAAVSARTGSMVNPFSTGWFGVPNLYPAVQGWLASVTGADLAAHRVLGALVGTVGVLATWRFGRLVIGAWPALAGAALMATLPFHLYFSRSALNHITDPTTLMLALLFLWRGVHSGRRGDALLCGMMIGLGWYGYWGARIFPVIVALILAIAATNRRFGLSGAVRLGLWSATGFVATTLPLLIAFTMKTGEFQNRLAATSPLSLDAWRDDPSDVLHIYLDNLREAVFFPFVSNQELFFRHPAPFLGWPMALLILVGVASWIAGLVREHAFRTGAWLAAPWLVLAFGVATTDPVQSQRFVAFTPIWMLAAGSGLVALARWVSAVSLPARAVVQHALLVGAIGALAFMNITWMASEDRQLTTYGDVRTIAAWDIGWRLAHGDPGGEDGQPVLFVGAPFMFIDDWQNLRFQAPNADLTDVAQPIVSTADVPSLPSGAILLLVPERAGERCTVEQAHPEVTVAEAHARNGRLLYVAFYRGELPGWSTAQTPAGTTFDIAEDTECTTTAGIQ